MRQLESSDGITIDFECSMIDFFCKNTETAAETLAQGANWLSQEILSESALEADGALWDVAAGEAGWWLGFAIAIMMMTSMIGITLAIVRQRPDLVKRVGMGRLMLVPAVMFSYWAVQQGLILTDYASDMLIERADVSQLMLVFSGQGPYWSQAVVQQANQVSMIIVFVLFFIGLLFIAVALAFRDFVLLLLIAFAPLAYILLPFENGMTWVKRWAAVVVAMLLTKPLIIGTLSLLFAGFGAIASVFSFQALSLGIGMIITAFMPLMAMSFFSFIGGSDASDQVGGRAAASAAAPVKRGLHAIPRVRTGAAGAAGAAGRSSHRQGNAGGAGPGGSPSKTGTPTAPSSPKGSAGGSAKQESAPATSKSGASAAPVNASSSSPQSASRSAPQVNSPISSPKSAPQAPAARPGAGVGAQGRFGDPK